MEQQRNPSAPFGGTIGGTHRHSVPEVARLLGISERAVRKRIETGKMRAERDGRNWIVLLDSPSIGTDGGTSAVPPSEPSGTTIIGASRQAQADVVLQRVLAPFIVELGAVREELGATRNELHHERGQREQAERERDELRARLAAAEDNPPMQTHPVVPGGAEREPEVFPKQRWPWWMRLLAGK